MAIIAPVVSKMALTSGSPQEVYSCPSNKSYAILDISFFRKLTTTDTLIEIGLTTKTSAAALNSLDYFVDDIQMSNTVNFVEMNKLIVGPGERVYANVVEGDDVNIRLHGVERVGGGVLQAGRLAAHVGTAVTKETVIVNNAAGAGYLSGSMTIYNAHNSDTAQIEVWITSQEDPSDIDQVAQFDITSEDTAIFESIYLGPGERLVVRSSQNLTEYFLNGMITEAM